MSKLAGRIVLASATLGLATVTGAPSAFAQCDENNYYWVAGSGDWFAPTNWRHEWWDPELEECVDVSGVPSCDDTVWITNGGIPTIAAWACVLWLGVDSSSIELAPGGALLVLEPWEHIGAWGAGHFGQTGGTHTTEGLILGRWTGARQLPLVRRHIKRR